MNITHSLYTDVGSREVNEDCISYAGRGGAECFVLCDGLGGHGKGELASQFVAESLCSSFEQAPDSDSFFESALTAAQEGLIAEQKRIGAVFEMKTTAVVLVIEGSRWRYAFIGDSRLYHFRKCKPVFRTLDHSVPQMLALAGDIKEKQIRCHPDRNRLLRVMGVEWDSPRYEYGDWQELREGDAFLLCSDGFWEPITEKEMSRLLKKASGAEDWLAAMSETVKANGAGTDMDNNSAIAVVCKGG